MGKLKERARQLIKAFKGNDYIFGPDCLDKIGYLASFLGKRTLLITNLGQRSPEDLSLIVDSLNKQGIEVMGPVPSARPNAPREDVLRLAEAVRSSGVDNLIVVAGGSGIDAAKAALVLATLGGEVEHYFGVGKVTEEIAKTGKKLIPLMAVQTAAGSAAHLTKYSNITDLQTSQKKLIVDEAIIPPKALFDYRLTFSAPLALTLDGAFDGLAHCLEVFYGASSVNFKKIREIVEVGIELLVANLPKVLADQEDIKSREAIGLGTDLGGYAIMIGGTNGPHLNSFSLVDVLSHGRACAILVPYYTIFFFPAIQPQLKILSQIFAKYGFIDAHASKLKGRALAEAVAEAMWKMARKVTFPISFQEVNGFEQAHIERALIAAKNPQLEMKLKNMPIPLSKEMIDNYMRPILEAAYRGDFSIIRTVKGH